MTITIEPVRRCAEKDCTSPALTRKGASGPYPRRCAEHTAARKRAISHHPLKPKEERFECCEQDRLCPQHKQQRDELREQAAKDLARDSASQIFGLLDAELEAAGIQIVIPGEDKPRYWRTNYGPYEGRTSEKIGAPSLRYDNEARAFYRANPSWHKASGSNRGDWPEMWEPSRSPLLTLLLFRAALGEKLPVPIRRGEYVLAV